MTVPIPYGRGQLLLEVDPRQVRAVLKPGDMTAQPASEADAAGHAECMASNAFSITGHAKSMASNAFSIPGQIDAVRQALTEPIASARLADLAAPVRKVLVITSDHTRPVPSTITLPLLLEEIRRDNPVVAVKILVATGFHRLTRTEELAEKFGPDLFQQEDIIVHDSRDRSHLVYKGLLPSSGELWLNDLVDWADLIVAEGFIEPHFFAGFSGGRKSILPGIAAAETVLANHCSAFIASPQARTGNLADNPLHRDMLFAAQKAGLAFILNVALDDEKRIVRAFAGHPDQAHLAGCAFVGERAAVPRVMADIVITSNGGYPLDQNIYQAVKGMTAGEACVRKDGVIIMAAACEDGHGGDAFYRWFAEESSPAAILRKIKAIDQQHTLPDQWEAQILARVLEHCRVILVTDCCDPDLVRAMQMQHAPDLATALAMATAMTMETAMTTATTARTKATATDMSRASMKAGRQPDIVVIPDGVGVIVTG